MCVCVLQARSEYLILLLLPQSDLSADAAANLVLAGGMQRQRQRQEGRAATRPPTASTIRSHQITSSLCALSHLFTSVLHLYARFYASRVSVAVNLQFKSLICRKVFEMWTHCCMFFTVHISAVCFKHSPTSSVVFSA